MTYSIVARDPRSGELGVAVASRSFNLSWLCGWPGAGVGVVVTQANTNPAFGPSGLDLMRAGRTAEEVVASLLAGDPELERRQLAVVDGKGRAAAHTGTECTPHTGHLLGSGYSVQGNLLASDAVVPAMADAFEQAAGPLAGRLLASMEAGQTAGGDARGRQSAVLITVSGDAATAPWARLVDFQIADHAEPLAEIRRLLDLQERLQRSGRGILAVFDGRVDEALELLDPMGDDLPEVAFNRTLALFAAGRVDRVPGAVAFLDTIA